MSPYYELTIKFHADSDEDANKVADRLIITPPVGVLPRVDLKRIETIMKYPSDQS